MLPWPGLLCRSLPLPIVLYYKCMSLWGGCRWGGRRRVPSGRGALLSTTLLPSPSFIAICHCLACHYCYCVTSTYPSPPCTGWRETMYIGQCADMTDFCTGSALMGGTYLPLLTLLLRRDCLPGEGVGEMLLMTGLYA